jgi:hypothetical protein
MDAENVRRQRLKRVDAWREGPKRVKAAKCLWWGLWWKGYRKQTPKAPCSAIFLQVPP